MKKILILFLCIIVFYPSAVFAGNVKMTEEYMEESGFYRYYLDDEYYIESNVQLGAVVKNIVKLTYNDYVNVVLYKDGEIQPYESGDYIYGDGEYTVVVKNDINTGRVNFILDTVSAESIDLEDEFYNSIKFTQSYDTDRRMYKEDMGEFYTLYSTVPNLSVTNKGVRIYFNEDESAYISGEKDGEEIEVLSGKLYSEPGYYSINVVYDVDTSLGDDYLEDVNESDLYAFSEESMDQAEAYTPSESQIYGSVATVAEFKFLIVNTPQNRLNYINPPQDYIISSIILDGKRVDIKDNSFYKTESDGQYKITFKSVDGTMPDYSFSYVKDRKAPTLTLENIGDGGIAKDKLLIVKNDKNSQTEISSNGSVLKFENDVIDTDGLYKIKVTDEAGNFNSYLVNVDIPIHISIIFILFIIAVAVIAIWLYVKHIGSNIQIR